MNYKIELLGFAEPFQEGTLTLWSNKYIAQNVLKKHLDMSVDSGSRKIEIIDKSVEWIKEQSILSPDILDIGCGPGIYGRKLSKIVKSYDGIDISPYQITYANKYNKVGENIKYIWTDFRDWIPHKKYDTALLLYAIYSFYKRDERIKLLKKIKGCLNPKGKTIIEVFTKNHYAKRKNTTDWQFIKNNGFWSPEPHVELNSFSWYFNNLILIRAAVIKDDIDVWNSWIQIFDTEMIEEELRLAGFSKVICYGSCFGEQYNLDSDVLCVCAE